MIFDALHEYFQQSEEPYGPLNLYSIPSMNKLQKDYIGIARPKVAKIPFNKAGCIVDEAPF